MTTGAPLPVPSSHPVAFEAPPRPSRLPLAGRWSRVEPLDPARHGDDLAAVGLGPDAAESWHFLPYGPFPDRAAFDRHLAGQAASDDPLLFAVRDGDAEYRARGVASLMSIVPEHGSIEVGHIWFSPALQRRRAASEAIVTLVRHAVALGYRRVEWKCDAANAASRRAAERLGFRFEGLFRRHRVVKGRNRDTAWYSIVAEEWPAVEAAYARWLDPANFDADGRQRTRLACPPDPAGQV